MPKSNLTRRDLFGLTAAGAFCSVLGLPHAAAAEAIWGRNKKPKNIIFCVSDGMSAAVPTMVDQYLELTTGRGSYWASLMNEDYVVNGLQSTKSLTGPVTDSSAASSAWGSGVHVWNGAVNWLPGGIELRTLLDIMKTEAKMRTGLVTTATVTHATPAGFAVAHESRDDEAGIAEKYLKLCPDVLMGGGDKFFSSTLRKDKVDLYGKFVGQGYTVVKNLSEMRAADLSKPLLGIFSGGHMPYTVDHNHDPKLKASTPTLAQMTSTAISQLKGGSGFVLQIEGARIDHGGHTNDFAAQLFDQLAFEDAVRVAVEFALEDQETLVVVTSDHGNGNPGLAGAGDEYFESAGGLKLAQNMTCSFVPILVSIKLKATPDNVIEVVKDRYQIELSRDEAQFVADGLSKTSPTSKIRVLNQDFSNLAMALSNHTHVNYMTYTHTSDHVLVSALGPGCEFFNGLTSNISYFSHFLSSRDLSVTNLTMDFETAKSHYVKSNMVAGDHWH